MEVIIDVNLIDIIIIVDVIIDINLIDVIIEVNLVDVNLIDVIIEVKLIGVLIILNSLTSTHHPQLVIIDLIDFSTSSTKVPSETS